MNNENTQHTKQSSLKPGGKESIVDHFIYRKISAQVTNILIKTPITPNQTTILSFIFCLIASYFFATESYSNILWGVFFVNIFHIFDCVDGEIARIKKLSSKFGYWLDGIIDRIGLVCIVTGIVLGQYNKLVEQNILFVGFIAIANTIILGILILIRAGLFSSKAQTFKFKNNFYIGYPELIVIITFFALLNKLVIVLWIIATLFPIAYIKSLIGIIKKHYESQRLSN